MPARQGENEKYIFSALGTEIHSNTISLVLIPLPKHTRYIFKIFHPFVSFVPTNPTFKMGSLILKQASLSDLTQIAEMYLSPSHSHLIPISFPAHLLHNPNPHLSPSLTNTHSFLTLLTTSSSPRLTLEFAHCTPAAVASYNIAALRAELEAVASLGEEAEAWKVVDGDGEVVVGYAVWGWSGSVSYFVSNPFFPSKVSMHVLFHSVWDIGV